MDDTGVTRRAFAAGTIGVPAVGVVAPTAGVAGAQQETTTTSGGGRGSGDGGNGVDGERGEETRQHGGESFRLGRDLQILLAAVVLAALSPIAFAIVLFAGSDRGRGPAE